QEIYKDRQKFSEQVFNVASSDLVNMGISVVSYTLKDIHDDQVTRRGHGGGGQGHWERDVTSSPCPPGPQDYLHSLGKGRTAQVQRDARVGEAEAKRDAGIRVRLCHLCHPPRGPSGSSVCPRTPQVARTKQQIEEERAQVLVVERAQQAQLQEHEIGRRERELEATVRKPAEAERYRLERLAEAER
ncbi:FLOT1 protein, partial [Trogon melanurus]|nr:FLOT1 protein [Trogon melanurus]